MVEKMVKEFLNLYILALRILNSHIIKLNCYTHCYTHCYTLRVFNLPLMINSPGFELFPKYILTFCTHNEKQRNFVLFSTLWLSNCHKVTVICVEKRWDTRIHAHWMRRETFFRYKIASIALLSWKILVSQYKFSWHILVHSELHVRLRIQVLVSS